MRVFILLASCVVAAGCGAGATVSCDFRKVDTGTLRCQEFSDSNPAESPATVAAFKLGCTSGGGAYADAPCPRAGIVAGCKQDNTGTASSINWYYDNPTSPGVLDHFSSPADVKSKVCDKGNPKSTLVTP